MEASVARERENHTDPRTQQNEQKQRRKPGLQRQLQQIKEQEDV